MTLSPPVAQLLTAKQLPLHVFRLSADALDAADEAGTDRGLAARQLLGTGPFGDQLPPLFVDDRLDLGRELALEVGSCHGYAHPLEFRF